MKVKSSLQLLLFGAHHFGAQNAVSELGSVGFHFWMNGQLPHASSLADRFGKPKRKACRDTWMDFLERFFLESGGTNSIMDGFYKSNSFSQ